VYILYKSICRLVVADLALELELIISYTKREVHFVRFLIKKSNTLLLNYTTSISFPNSFIEFNYKFFVPEAF